MSASTSRFTARSSYSCLLYTSEGRATASSDLDLLVEFDHPTVSLIKLNALKYDLEDALGLPVDVIHAPLPANSMIQPGKVVRVL